MLPTLGHIGPFTVSTYTVLIDLGLAAALAALYLRAPAGQTGRWVDAGLAAIVGAFAGARLVYIIIHGDYFLPHIDDIIKFWQGGLAWPGAALGGWLGAWLYSRRRALALGPVLDALALPIGLLSLLGWTGCAASGCAYGFEVNPGQWPAWLTTHAPDLYGLSVPRFPTQLLGMAWSLLALVLIHAMGRRATRRPPGALGALVLSLVALGMLVLSFTRGDPAPFVSGFRLDVAGSALVLLAALAGWAWSQTRPPSAHAPDAGAVQPAAKEPPAPEASASQPVANP